MTGWTLEQRQAAATAVCKSGKFECGQGCCAAICMDQLGDARKGPCAHAVEVHGKLIDIVLAVPPSLASMRKVVEAAERVRDTARSFTDETGERYTAWDDDALAALLEVLASLTPSQQAKETS